MTIALLVLSLGLFGSSAAVHEATAGPPVTILKFAWDYSWNVDAGPGMGDAAIQSVPPGVQGSFESPRNRVLRGELPPLPKEAIEGNETGRGSVHPGREIYTYKVKLRNMAGRAIRAIEWEYVTVDTQSQAELGRLKFNTSKKIDPGKTKVLSVSTWVPPTQTMSVRGLGRKSATQAGESIQILRIQFADGSFWSR